MKRHLKRIITFKLFYGNMKMFVIVISFFINMNVSYGLDIVDDLSSNNRARTLSTTLDNNETSTSIDYVTSTKAFTNYSKSESEIANNNCTLNSTDACPALCGNYDNLNNNIFLDILLDPCRYDKESLPVAPGPLNVSLQMEVSYMEVNTESHQIELHLLLAMNYYDPRLRFQEISSTRYQIMGGQSVVDKIWTPHLYVPNKQRGVVTGEYEKDVFVVIENDGKVSLQKRLSLTTLCWMNLMKFPFDDQLCKVEFQSWSHESHFLQLQWENNDPLTLTNNFFLTEFDLIEFSTQEYHRKRSVGILNNGKNYSTVSVEFRISRQIGFYLLDFFVPSFLLVTTSWVSFWLQADASPARTVLGTSTMLSFITLSLGQYSSFPKTTYITLGEIWFLGCTIFIFLSITEFAFANLIWRRKKNAEFLKMKSKYILKYAITPRLARKSVLNNLSKSNSTQSLNINDDRNSNNQTTYKKSKRSISVPAKYIVNGKIIDEKKDFAVEISNSEENLQPAPVLYNMTPQEIAIWLDRKSRVVFPCTFLVFNIIYWVVVLNI